MATQPNPTSGFPAPDNSLTTSTDEIPVPASSRCTIIKAPSRPPPPPPSEKQPTIFLAGNTSGSTSAWRADLIALLSHKPYTFLDPSRPDWDSSWREALDFAPYREQVEWELEMAQGADVVVVHFGPDVLAPVSLLELGLCIGGRSTGRGGGNSSSGGRGRRQRCRAAAVACAKGYPKRGNVLLTCEKYGVDVCESVEELAEMVVRCVDEVKRRDVL